jgi:hypothetical protein
MHQMSPAIAGLFYFPESPESFFAFMGLQENKK